MKGNTIIVFPEFPAFDELEEEELKNVLGYLTSVPRLAIKKPLIAEMKQKSVLSNPSSYNQLILIQMYIFCRFTQIFLN